MRRLLRCAARRRLTTLARMQRAARDELSRLARAQREAAPGAAGKRCGTRAVRLTTPQPRRESP
jgi:hypothetical protein